MHSPVKAQDRGPADVFLMSDPAGEQEKEKRGRI